MRLAVAAALVAAVAGGAAIVQSGRAGPAGASCRVHGSLPDPRCTPGAVDPALSGPGARATVCSSSFARRPGPPPATLAAASRQALARYPEAAARPEAFVADRLIPRSLGGDPASPRNVWPLPRGAALGVAQKRAVVAYLRRSVCSGAMSLHAAQADLRRDWLAEYLDTATG